jgi:hypothetical protein
MFTVRALLTLFSSVFYKNYLLALAVL